MDSSVVGRPCKCQEGVTLSPDTSVWVTSEAAPAQSSPQISDGTKGEKLHDVSFPGQLFQMDTVTRDGPGRASPVHCWPCPLTAGVGGGGVL